MTRMSSDASHARLGSPRDPGHLPRRLLPISSAASRPSQAADTSSASGASDAPGASGGPAGRLRPAAGGSGALPSPVVRTVGEAEFAEWVRAKKTGFLDPPVVPEEEVAVRLRTFEPDRTWGAFDGGRCVATYQTFAQEVTAVGGAAVPASAVSGVTVSPTHRRRGLLRRMMAEGLADARERGDVLASLIAAEYPIYGRYGFGPATWSTVWEVDLLQGGARPALVRPVGRRPYRPGRRGGRPRVRPRAARPGAGAAARHGEPLGPRLGAQHGVDPHPSDGWKEPFYAAYRSAAGEVEGYVAYSADGKWDDAKQPVNTVVVHELLAASPDAEQALWRYVCAIDWVTRVRSGHRAPDDLLPLLLPDPRAARVLTHADMLWLRILDVPRALEARTYAVPGVLVLEVRDAAGFAGGGSGWTPRRRARPARPPRRPRTSWRTWRSWPRCTWGTSRRSGWRRWAGWRRPAPGRRPRPTCCFGRHGARGARTSSERPAPARRRAVRPASARRRAVRAASARRRAVRAARHRGGRRVRVAAGSG